MIGTLRSIARRLEGGPPRRGWALAATLLYTFASRRLRVFSVDRAGRWVSRQRGGVLVSPVVHTLEHEELARADLDQWTYGYRPRRGDVVVDVGAGIGEEVITFSRLVGPEGRVVAIESHPGTFACLAETVRRSGLANVTLVQCAVADQDGRLVITDGADPFSNSIVEAAGGGLEVEAHSLDSLLGTLAIEGIDLLKMNIEGAETLALTGMGRTLPLVRHAVVSCHDFVADRGGPASLRTRDAVTRHLAAAGFDLRSRPGDAREWVRDFVYAANRRSLSATGPSPSSARAA